MTCIKIADIRLKVKFLKVNWISIKLLKSNFNCSILAHIEVIFVPLFEVTNELLLGLVNALGDLTACTLNGFKFSITRSVSFLELLHSLEESKFIFIYDFLRTIFIIHDFFLINCSQLVLKWCFSFVLLLVEVRFANINVLLGTIALLS